MFSHPGNYILLLLILFNLNIGCNWSAPNKSETPKNLNQKVIYLPAPLLKSNTSIEEALFSRRSVRNFSDAPLEIQEIAQLLWAAQGITSKNKTGRTAPSAGALYPLEIYLASRHINSISQGVYHYRPSNHSLIMINNNSLSAASMQASFKRSAAVIVIAAEFHRTTKKYAERGIRYVQMEAGHAAQNICLQAVSLNIGAVTIGSFSDSIVKQMLGLPASEVPLYLIPAGKKS